VDVDPDRPAQEDNPDEVARLLTSLRAAGHTVSVSGSGPVWLLSAGPVFLVCTRPLAAGVRILHQRAIKPAAPPRVAWFTEDGPEMPT
jgi:hypothetical protein